MVKITKYIGKEHLQFWGLALLMVFIGSTVIGLVMGNPILSSLVFSFLFVTGGAIIITLIFFIAIPIVHIITKEEKNE